MPPSDTETDSPPAVDANMPPRRFVGPDHPITSALVGAGLVAMLTYLVLSRPDAAPDVPAAPPSPVLSEPAPPVAAAEVQRAHFYDSEVEPLITQTDALNREAADRCVARLRRVFAGYHAGVLPFVEDLTSISTRLGIVRRMPGNWWRKDNRIQTYVQGKFETHLFSEQKLLADISSVLEEFRRDVDANQKHMLINVRAALGSSDLPDVNVEEYQPFFAAVSKQLQGYAAKQGTSSVMNALGVLIISEAGVFAARSVITGLLARFGTAAAASAAAAGGATAGASAAGAGGGTLAGPVGTAVGFGVGLAVGLVIDWWMTEKFEAQMKEQMHFYLDALGETILYGNPRSPSPTPVSQTDQPGIIDALPVVCDRLQEAYRQRFYQQIVTRGSSS